MRLLQVLMEQLGWTGLRLILWLILGLLLIAASLPGVATSPAGEGFAAVSVVGATISTLAMLMESLGPE